MQFQVLNNLLTGPLVDETGTVTGRLHAVKGDLLSADDLRGMDIDRLIGLGAIAQSADDAPAIVEYLAPLVREPFFDAPVEVELRVWPLPEPEAIPEPKPAPAKHLKRKTKR